VWVTFQACLSFLQIDKNLRDRKRVRYGILYASDSDEERSDEISEQKAI